jgi:hypothetical protein
MIDMSTLGILIGVILTSIVSIVIGMKLVENVRQTELIIERLEINNQILAEVVNALNEIHLGYIDIEAVDSDDYNGEGWDDEEGPKKKNKNLN